MVSSHAKFWQQVERILNAKDFLRCSSCEAPREEFIWSRPVLNAHDRSTLRAKDPLTPLIPEAMPERWMVGDIGLPHFLVHLKPRDPEPEMPEDADSSAGKEEQEEAEAHYSLYLQELKDWQERSHQIDFVELDVLVMARTLKLPCPATLEVSARRRNETPASAGCIGRGEPVERYPCSKIDVVLLGPVAKDPNSGDYVFDSKKCVEVKRFPVAVNKVNGEFKLGHLRCIVRLEAGKESYYLGKLGTHSALFLQIQPSAKVLMHLIKTEAIWMLIKDLKGARKTHVQLHLVLGIRNEERGDTPYDAAADENEEHKRYSLAAESAFALTSPAKHKQEQTRKQCSKLACLLNKFSSNFVKMLYWTPTSPWYHGFTYEIKHALTTHFECARYGTRKNIFAWN